MTDNEQEKLWDAIMTVSPDEFVKAMQENGISISQAIEHYVRSNIELVAVARPITGDKQIDLSILFTSIVTKGLTIYCQMNARPF